MIDRRVTLSMCIAAAVTARGALADVEFSDDCDADSSASWVVNTSSSDTAVTFGFDYSALGIPPSPSSAGTTIGLRLAANMDLPSSTESVTLTPAGVAMSGSYQLRFEMWMNANGPFPLGGTGSTEFVTCGIGYDGTSLNQGGAGGSGAWFAVAGEGGSSRDYRAYRGPFEQFAESGQFFAGGSSSGGGAHNSSDPYYAAFGGINVASAVPTQTAAHPNQTGTTASGAPAFGWHEVTVTVDGTVVRWEMDGLSLAEMVASTGAPFETTGGVSIGYMDIFSSVSDNAAVSFAIIDNVSVCSPACESVIGTGACCAADGTCSDGSQAECVVLGGTYQGDGTDCGAVTCPVTFGACCYGNGGCDDTVDESQCVSAGGTFNVGLVCGDLNCPDTVNGADVIYYNTQDIRNWGEINSVRGYSLGSWVCNIGDQNLRWGSTVNGTPVLVFNAYRLHNGRIEQLGMSSVKHSCCVTNTYAGCGDCNNVNGQLLGAGCRDIYSANYNGRQDRMGPRHLINAFSGTIPTGWDGQTGDAIFRRIQIRESDLLQEPDGAIYLTEGVFVGDDDAAAGNALNNASYKLADVNEQNFDITPVGDMFVGTAAILAWRHHGNGVGMADNDVRLANIDVPGEGRFTAAAKATDNGDGTWRYEYAVFNLNSHRSGGSFQVPIPPATNVINAGFHDVDYHSGEPYDNTDWIIETTSNAVVWRSPQTFAQNPDSNALRWGTMYNFWFDADAAPVDGAVSLGLFRPGVPAEVQSTLPVPGGCFCDLDGTTGVSVGDLLAYLALWFEQDDSAELTGDEPPSVDVVDLLTFLDCWFTASAGGPCG